MYEKKARTTDIAALLWLPYASIWSADSLQPQSPGGFLLQCCSKNSLTHQPNWSATRIILHKAITTMLLAM